MARARVGAQQQVLAVVGEGERGPVLRVVFLLLLLLFLLLLLREAGDVRGGVEVGDVEDGEGGLVEVAQVVEQDGRGAGGGDGEDGGGGVVGGEAGRGDGELPVRVW